MNKQRQDGPAPMKLWILHDRSGSMQRARQGVVDGTNAILKEQSSQSGRCRVTIAQFDSDEPLRIAVDARRVERVRMTRLSDFEPRGLTPLYDAIADLIGRADRRIADRSRRGRPAEDQTVVIISDGMENHSSDFTQQQVFQMITDRRRQGWTFVFLGADQDSYAVGSSLGVAPGNISNWDASDEGALRAHRSVSRALTQRRQMPREQRGATSDDFFGGVREAEDC